MQFTTEKKCRSKNMKTLDSIYPTIFLRQNVLIKKPSDLFKEHSEILKNGLINDVGSMV